MSNNEYTLQALIDIDFNELLEDTDVTAGAMLALGAKSEDELVEIFSNNIIKDIKGVINKYDFVGLLYAQVVNNGQEEHYEDVPSDMSNEEDYDDTEEEDAYGYSNLLDGVTTGAENIREDRLKKELSTEILKEVENLYEHTIGSADFIVSIYVQSDKTAYYLHDFMYKYLPENTIDIVYDGEQKHSYIINYKKDGENTSLLSKETNQTDEEEK